MVLFAQSEDTAYFHMLEDLLKQSSGSKDQLHQAIVNSPFSDRRRATLLGLGIVVLLQANKKSHTIDRIALSDTDLAKGAVRMSVRPFHDIKIPIDYKGNFIVDAIKSDRYQQTSDWQYLFAPALTPEEARLNQAGAGIGCSFVYPLIDTTPASALIFSFYVTLDKIQKEHHDFMRKYSRSVSNILNKK